MPGIAIPPAAGAIANPGESQLPLVGTLSLGLVAALLAMAFALLSGEMLAGDTRAFDMALLRVAPSLRAAHPGVSEATRDFSGLGRTVVPTLFSAITGGYWRWSRHAPVPSSLPPGRPHRRDGR